MTLKRIVPLSLGKMLGGLHAMAGDEDKAYEQGCNAYLSKPIDEDELWATVAQHIA